MAHVYEVSTPMLGRAVFELAFVRYLESIGYHHLRAGGLAGSQTSHEFQRGDEFVALAIVSEGQGDCHIVVESDTVPVESLIVEVLTEGLADSLQVFGNALNVGDEKVEGAVAGQSLAGRLPGAPSPHRGSRYRREWKKPTQ